MGNGHEEFMKCFVPGPSKSNYKCWHGTVVGAQSMMRVADREQNLVDRSNRPLPSKDCASASSAEGAGQHCAM